MGVKIEELMQVGLKKIIDQFVGKYADTFNNKLGMTEEDLLNDMREQIWKGLLTWNKAGKTKLSTYLICLIKNRFNTLLDKSTVGMRSRMDYYSDVFSSVIEGSDGSETQDTGEALFLHRQEIMRDRDSLEPAEREIYMDLLMGYSIAEMMTKHDLSRMEVITSIKSINQRVGERRDNTSKGAL